MVKKCSVDGTGSSENTHQPQPKRPKNLGTTSSSSSLVVPPKKENEEQEKQVETTNVDASRKPMVVVDPDLLDCPICFEPLQSPVYQCNNGHIVCEACWKNIKICPTCTFPIVSIRCRAIERIVESATISCVYKQYGCVEKVSYLRKLDHEGICKYSPIPCPMRDCKYIGSTKCLYSHFAENHPNSCQPFTFNTTKGLSVFTDTNSHGLLQERETKILFVLHCVAGPLGSLVSVTCVAPVVSDMKFSFELRAISGDNLTSLKYPVELIPECFAQPTKGLLVWDDFHELKNGKKRLHLRLVIREVSVDLKRLELTN